MHIEENAVDEKEVALVKFRQGEKKKEEESKKPENNCSRLILMIRTIQFTITIRKRKGG